MATQVSHRVIEAANLAARNRPLAHNPASRPKAMALREEVTKVAGMDIQVFKMGVGNPLLLLHGLSGSLARSKFVSMLAERFTVHMPTHPGFGKSERPFWIQSPADLAAFYTWYLEVEELERIPIIGCSLGGQVAAEMLAVTGRTFSKVILVGPSGLGPIYFDDPNLPGMLSRVKTPTHIVWGANDTTVPVSAAERYRQAITGSRLTIIKRSGHNPHKDRPEEFLKVAMEFFGDLC